MDKLPEEILLRIFTNGRICSSRNLRKLVLVSQKFHRIAKPLLYSKCELNDGTLPIKRMLNTLVTTHDTRSLIRCLEVGVWEPHNEAANDVRSATISITELSNIVQSIETLDSCPLDFQKRFGIALLNSSRDAMIAAILSLLPKLDALRLRRSPGGRRMIGDKIIQDFSPFDLARTLIVRLMELATTPPLAGGAAFKHLTYLSVNDDKYEGDTYSCWDACPISVSLKLPALKKFFGCDCGDVDSDSRWTCDEGVSGVTIIHLENCQIGAETIRRTLRSCCALDEFHCHRVCQSCLDEEAICDYSYADIHHDLFRHRKSLSCLQLDNQSCGHLNFRDQEPITTLVELESLIQLWVDDDALFGHLDEDEENARSLSEILPPGLRYINMKGDTAGRQRGIFREVRRLLLSNTDLESVTFRGAYILDARHMVEELSGVAIEVLGARYLREYGAFRMYRAVSRQVQEALENECQVQRAEEA